MSKKLTRLQVESNYSKLQKLCSFDSLQTIKTLNHYFIGLELQRQREFVANRKIANANKKLTVIFENRQIKKIDYV